MRFFALCAALLALTGCASIPFAPDYCDIAVEKRCAMEGAFEGKFNTLLGGVQTNARVDIVVNCPDGGTCTAPTFGVGEKGDFDVQKIIVAPTAMLNEDELIRSLREDKRIRHAMNDAESGGTLLTDLVVEETIVSQ